MRYCWLLLLLSLPGQAWAICGGSSPTWTSTPDVTSVSNCVTNASTGDTINVQAGASTWASGITLSKNISIIGAGIGNTVITAGTSLLFNITVIDNSTLQRISGFTFNMNGTSNRAMVVTGSNVALASKTGKIRIDHNRFTNSTAVSPFNGGIYNQDGWGVIDSNQFDLMNGPIRNIGTTSGAGNWTNWGPLTYGDQNTMWIENNTFSLPSGIYMITDCDQGGRFSMRYNTITGTAPFPYSDYHGYTNSGEQSCFGGEIYGNVYPSNGGPMVSQRAGRVLIFNNKSLSGSPEWNLYNNDSCSPDSRQNINNSYGWNNRSGNTGAIVNTTSSGGDTCGFVIENSTFWLDGSSSTGDGVTVGVGKGPLASRSATCTPGVGYWATTQSVTDLTGMTGVNPSTPISGTLYQCGSTAYGGTSGPANQWVAVYTPLVFPHPLVSGFDTTPPAPPTGVFISRPIAPDYLHLVGDHP